VEPRQRQHATGALDDKDKYFYSDGRGLPIMMRLFEDYVGKKLLEVGAGVGAVAGWFNDRGRNVVAVEPEPLLAERIRSREGRRPIEVVEKESLAAYDELASQAREFDTVLYVSVLEHIEDDLREFKEARKVLTTGGNLIIFVPALQWLYSRNDAATGHVRRYSRKRLEWLAQVSGYEVSLLRHFEVVGIIPYLVICRLLRRIADDAGSKGLYNNVILPLSALVDKVLRGRLIGKNLVLVARKP
jgi:SAM-dependent methyltransferase